MENGSDHICSLDWIRRKSWPELTSAPSGTVNLVDLFSGCGGLTLGAWEAARLTGRTLDIKLAVDLCDDALAVYRANFGTPSTVAAKADVQRMFPGALGSPLRANETALAEHLGAIDVLVAGPPCQGHSDLNNHTRRRDPRNRLYLRAIRAVEVLRPRVVLIENVGPVVHDSAKVVERSIKLLESLGYSLTSRIVRGA